MYCDYFLPLSNRGNKKAINNKQIVYFLNQEKHNKDPKTYNKIFGCHTPFLPVLSDRVIRCKGGSRWWFLMVLVMAHIWCDKGLGRGWILESRVVWNAGSNLFKGFDSWLLEVLIRGDSCSRFPWSCSLPCSYNSRYHHIILLFSIRFLSP